MTQSIGIIFLCMVPNFSQKLATFGSEPLQPASELMKLKRVREEKQQLDLWCL
jgi:hypothetical protein